jgi:hypothetical protein
MRVGCEPGLSEVPQHLAGCLAVDETTSLDASCGKSGISLKIVWRFPGDSPNVIKLTEAAAKNLYGDRPDRKGRLQPRKTLEFSFAVEIDAARRELRRAGAIVHVGPQVFDSIAPADPNLMRLVRGSAE